MERKEFDTKIPDDINTDSGFLSGPLSGELYSSENINSGELLQSGNIDSAGDVDSKNDSDSYVQLDSGLDLSEQLHDLQLGTSTAEPPLITVLNEKSQDVPPLEILFEQDDDGDTQLHIAAVHGCQKSVGTLISVCPNKMLLDIPNDYGHTALHLAVMSGHEVVTRMLVIAGANLGVRDVEGETPLHKATHNKNVQCLQALLAPIPEHAPRRLASILNQKNYNGQTCVHLAALSGHIETLQTLVYYGADINATEGLAGWSALHIAARRGDARLLQFLVERCGGVCPRPRDFAGRSPRQVAAACLARAFPPDSSDDDRLTDDENYESDSENLFEKLKDSTNPINVK